jgi:tRNA pseudouridine55 synthase
MGRKTKDSGIDGLLLVDKPAGWTSHDVVAKCRGAFKQKRAGHSGTLDPDATGVLLIGFGRVTKLLPFLTALPKTYTCEVVLGIETSTLDDSGETTKTYDMSAVTRNDVELAARNFCGDILQIPPMVSAIQVDGVRLHELARQGIEIERKARPVTIYSLSVDRVVEPGVFAITATCSSGTYVRTLAADLGTALGGGAHLRNLRRTSTGSFSADSGIVIDDKLGTQTLLSAIDAMRDYPSAVASADVASQVRNGRVVPIEMVPPSNQWRQPGTPDVWSVLTEDGELLAVYERYRELDAKPVVVLPTRDL